MRTINYRQGGSLWRLLAWLQFECMVFSYLVFRLKKDDILIASSLSLFSITTALLLKLIYRCKVIFEVRDIWPLTLVKDAGASPFNPLIIIFSIMEILGYRFSDHIVGTMPNLSQHVAKFNVPSAKVSCVPMGISGRHLSLFNFTSFESDDSSDKTCITTTDLGFSKSFPLVCYAGSFGLHNFLDPIFAAAVLASRNNAEINFLFVGDGYLFEKYKRKYSIFSNITFMSKVAKCKLPVILNSADLLIYSTSDSPTWRYGQSLNKLIDYIASKKPILGIYSGYLSEMEHLPSVHTINAHSVESAPHLLSKIKDLLALPPLVHMHTSEYSYRWLIQNRNYTKLATKYLNLLKSLS